MQNRPESLARETPYPRADRRPPWSPERIAARTPDLPWRRSD